MEIKQNGELVINLLPFSLIILAVILLVLWRKKYSLYHLLSIAIFGVYVVIALQVILFPIHVREPFIELMRRPEFQSINLIPFRLNLDQGINHLVARELFLNILLTVPFGFGAMFLKRVSVSQIFWLALLVGITTEGLQLLISLAIGYTYRAIDINDVIMNAIGVLVGYLLFRVVAWVYLQIIERLNLHPVGIMAFLHDVACRR